jgi:ketosteroid isomerase-like protein
VETVRQAFEAWNAGDIDVELMPLKNLEIALQQVDAFNRRDVEGVVAYASPKVEWEDSMFWTEHVRTYRGRAELRDWVEKVLEPWETLRVRADELAETTEGRVFARLSLTGRGKASGAVTEQHAWTVLWFANGLCTRRRVFRDRDEALEAAGLSE